MTEKLFGGGFEKKFPEIVAILPENELIVQSTEPTYYGADYLIARLARLPGPCYSTATWCHGWDDLREFPFPRLLICHRDINAPHLVASHRHRTALENFDCKNVHAVGVPFIYADVEGISRLPDSLLIMPPHSLGHTTHNWPFEEYAQVVSQLKTQFKRVAACIHPSCVENGLWFKQMEDHGIPWVMGANSSDKNALERMQIIFRSFEFMTTNAIGSHLAYAAYCGAKVSIYGPYADFEEEDYARDTFYQSNLDLLKYKIENYRKAAVFQRYPQFFVNPRDAVLQYEFAAQELGADCKREPEEVAKLLGWPVTKQKIKMYLKPVTKYLKKWIA